MDTQTGRPVNPVISSGGGNERRPAYPGREAPSIRRIKLLGVPLDIVPPGDLPEIIESLAVSGAGSADAAGSRNIVLLSLWDLLRARRNNEYRDYVLHAALVLPISKSLVSGAKFLTSQVPFRYMPFNFIISFLSLLERREASVYLLGSENKILRKAERNIRTTFPRLKVVGRYGGAVRKQEEAAVMEAIRKASPDLLLAGKGIRGEELWIAKNSDRLNRGFRLWCSDLFDVFAERKSRPSDAVFEKGLEAVIYCIENPLKFFRIVPYLRYKFLLLIKRFWSR